MEFSIRALAPQSAKAGCLVLGVYQASGSGAPVLTRAAAAADRAARGRLGAVLAQGDLSAKAGSTLLLHGVAGLAAQRILLVGLG
ncbi:MAG: leucyl aminopeptidase, partial [Betaproteobacteria bacterium]|nr:leucyl aminopeptidase [Betaproteobacteria bacterium]